MIMEAAMRVMRRNGFASAKLNDIIAEANLSTRAFYRHFQSKDDVLVALVRDEAEVVLRNLEARIDGVSDPLDALHKVVDEYLSLFYDPIKLDHVIFFGSDAVRVVSGFPMATSYMEKLHSSLIEQILRRGVAEQGWNCPHPANDALVVRALISHHAPFVLPTALSRDEAHERVMTYLAGLGIGAPVVSGPGKPQAGVRNPPWMGRAHRDRSSEPEPEEGHRPLGP
jgi:AcrR family transcriptional regulator